MVPLQGIVPVEQTSNLWKRVMEGKESLRIS